MMVAMRELASVEIGIAIEELKPRIESGYLRKFYDLGSGSFRFVFYKEKQNTSVYCRLLRALNETSFAEEAGAATPFAMGVRKRIENTLLTGLEQHGSDRIVLMRFSKKGYTLAIEMFGKGNIILMNSSGIIELAYRRLSFKDREIKPGVAYSLPGPSGLNLFESDENSIISAITAAPNEGKAINLLSGILNIGPLYLEDILNRSGIDPKGRIPEGAEKRLAQEVLAFASRAKSEKPRVYLREGKIIDYAICSIEKYSGEDSREYATLGAMLDSIHLGERSAPLDDGLSARRLEIKANIDKQRQLSLSMREEAVKSAEAGKLIFENMHSINRLISFARERKRATIEDLMESFPEFDMLGIDLKGKKIKLILGGS
jgi:predicted ribosome quality control (RQC) complex YloA/Tae2 family protein